MVGIELVEQARQTSVQTNLTINMITSDSDQELYQSVLARGVSEVFHKSDLSEIAEYIQHYKNRNAEQSVQGGHIIYVEDDRAISDYISALLRIDGYQLDSCTKAEDAFKLFHQKHYDLGITDYMLAGRNTGLSLVRKIRSLRGDANQRVPILIMSGQEDTATRVEILRSGANDYIAKPVLAEELSARVKIW